MALALLLAAGFLALAPLSAQAFDWPAGAAAAQKIQALKQEIYNLKTLLAASKSKTAIGAQSYIAVDLSTGKTLLQKNPEVVHSLASTAKLMTAVVARENLDQEKIITLTPKMLAPEGASPVLYAGLGVSARNLLKASLTQSVNDAAEALAQSAGKQNFLALMNAKAKELGMKSTVFVGVTGLDQASRSNAADMAKLVAYIDKNRPEIWEMTRDNNFWLPNAQGELLKFMNMNSFYYLPQFIGGKTGYLPEARDSFAAVFEINKKHMAIVLLHSPNYRSDTFKILNQLKTKI